MQLNHKSCSNCVFWSDIDKRIIPYDEHIEAVCEKQSTEWKTIFTTGGHYCGQWRKIKWLINPVIGVDNKKDYR